MDALLAQAEAADQRAKDPEALPKEIARRETWLRKMDEACARLQARARARAAAERAARQRSAAARQQRKGSAKSAKDSVAPSLQVTPKPDEQINLTDSESRVMRKSHRGATPRVTTARRWWTPVAAS